MDEEEPEGLYTKGFNNGYLLAKHEPNLAAQLTAQANEQSLYFNGLTGGKKQYEKEVREWTKSFSRGAPSNDERDATRER